MTEQNPKRIPQSPETQPADVREELHQNMVTHEGDKEKIKSGDHLGAVEDDVTPIKPPMRGPGNLVGETASGDSSDKPDSEIIDPRDELTPG